MADSALALPNTRRWPQWLGWLLLTVYFLTPAREAFDQSLDKSNYATYTHFIAHGFQWGRDVIPMTGPFGFILYGHTYSGEMFGARLLGDLLLKAAFAALLLHLFRRAAPGALRWVWLVGVILLVPTVDDLFHDFAILVAALVLLTDTGPRLSRWHWLATLMLGALALFKGTQLFTTGLCFGAVLLLVALERHWRKLAVLIAAYLGSITAFWILAGQNPLHLPAYFRGVLELSSGYNATMGLDELPFIRTAGLALVAGLACVFFWVAAVRGVRHARLGVTLLLLAGFSFIKWKHGYLRADGHVFIFFISAAIITLTVCLAAFTPLLGPAPAPLRGWRRYAGLALVTAVTGFAVLGAAQFWLWRVVRLAVDAPLQFQHNLQFLARPGLHRARLDAQLEHNRREAHAPQIQNEIGRDTVDFFGHEQGLLLLNRFNYHPRPMGGGSFNVFTPWLQERNEAFVRDARRAPAWEVLKLQTLDDRLPSADDPLTLRAILECYTPVLMQRDWLLLKHRQSPGAAAAVLLETRRVQPGEIVNAPDPGAGRMLLFSVDAPLSVRGRLRSFFYRPPELSARIVSRLNPRGRSFVLKPTMLRHPVILSPLLLDNLDVIQLFGDEAGNTVRSLQLDPAPGFDLAGLTVSFYAAPRPPKPEDCDILEILTYQRYPLHNRTPVELVTSDTGIRELNKEPITIVHAPGSITWELAPGDQQVIFSYGLMPQAYLDGGKTDGVEFNVEVLWPPNDGRGLFKRMMRPVTTESDRGMQRTRVFLPPYEPGARLRIRTDPGPDKDGAYDQSYVTRVQIKSGPVIPEQFNGLGVVPADGLLPHSSVAGVGRRPVFLLHAPAELMLNIPANAREVSCDIGLLPGAYENGGNTDGVAFAFDAVLPDGGKQRLLARYLDPVHQKADRGPQAVKLSLPALPAGTKLRLATAIGPNGDRGWDQSYVAGVSFR